MAEDINSLRLFPYFGGNLTSKELTETNLASMLWQTNIDNCIYKLNGTTYIDQPFLISSATYNSTAKTISLTLGAGKGYIKGRAITLEAAQSITVPSSAITGTVKAGGSFYLMLNSTESEGGSIKNYISGATWGNSDFPVQLCYVENWTTLTKSDISRSLKIAEVSSLSGTTISINYWGSASFCEHIITESAAYNNHIGVFKATTDATGLYYKYFASGQQEKGVYLSYSNQAVSLNTTTNLTSINLTTLTSATSNFITLKSNTINITGTTYVNQDASTKISTAVFDSTSSWFRKTVYVGQTKDTGSSYLQIGTDGSMQMFGTAGITISGTGRFTALGDFKSSSDPFNIRTRRIYAYDAIRLGSDLSNYIMAEDYTLKLYGKAGIQILGTGKIEATTSLASTGEYNIIAAAIKVKEKLRCGSDANYFYCVPDGLWIHGSSVVVFDTDSTGNLKLNGTGQLIALTDLSSKASPDNYNARIRSAFVHSIRIGDNETTYTTIGHVASSTSTGGNISLFGQSKISFSSSLQTGSGGIEFSGNGGITMDTGKIIATKALTGTDPYNAMFCRVKVGGTDNYQVIDGAGTTAHYGESSIKFMANGTGIIQFVSSSKGYIDATNDLNYTGSTNIYNALLKRAKISTYLLNDGDTWLRGATYLGQTKTATTNSYIGINNAGGMTFHGASTIVFDSNCTGSIKFNKDLGSGKYNIQAPRIKATAALLVGPATIATDSSYIFTTYNSTDNTASLSLYGSSSLTFPTGSTGVLGLYGTGYIEATQNLDVSGTPGYNAKLRRLYVQNSIRVYSDTNNYTTIGQNGNIYLYGTGEIKLNGTGGITLTKGVITADQDLSSATGTVYNAYFCRAKVSKMLYVYGMLSVAGDDASAQIGASSGPHLSISAAAGIANFNNGMSAEFYSDDPTKGGIYLGTQATIVGKEKLDDDVYNATFDKLMVNSLIEMPLAGSFYGPSFAYFGNRSGAGVQFSGTTFSCKGGVKLTIQDNGGIEMKGTSKIIATEDLGTDVYNATFKRLKVTDLLYWPTNFQIDTITADTGNISTLTTEGITCSNSGKITCTSPYSSAYAYDSEMSYDHFKSFARSSSDSVYSDLTHEKLTIASLYSGNAVGCELTRDHLSFTLLTTGSGYGTYITADDFNCIGKLRVRYGDEKDPAQMATVYGFQSSTIYNTVLPKWANQQQGTKIVYATQTQFQTVTTTNINTNKQRKRVFEQYYEFTMNNQDFSSTGNYVTVPIYDPESDVTYSPSTRFFIVAFVSLQSGYIGTATENYALPVTAQFANLNDSQIIVEGQLNKIGYVQFLIRHSTLSTFKASASYAVKVTLIEKSYS